VYYRHFGGPTVWNSLPVELRKPAVSNGVFQRTLRRSWSWDTSAPSAIEMLCVKLRYINLFWHWHTWRSWAHSALFSPRVPTLVVYRVYAVHIATLAFWILNFHKLV